MKNNKKNRFFYWSPRVLGLLFIVFLGIFALDVFIPEKPLYYYVIGIFMHLLPNFILLAFLVLAWKMEKLGGLLFIVAAIFTTAYFETYTHLINFSIISFPIFLIGCLFLLDYHMQTVKENE